MPTLDTVKAVSKEPLSGWYQPAAAHQEYPRPGGVSQPEGSPEPVPVQDAPVILEPVPALQAIPDAPTAQTVPPVPPPATERQAPLPVPTGTENSRRTDAGNPFWEEELRRTGHPGPKVCLPGRADAPGTLRFRSESYPVPETSPASQSVPAPEAASTSEPPKPEPSPAPSAAPRTVRFYRSEKRDSLSRLVSAQTCAAALTLALAFLLRTVSEPAFLTFQSALREAMTDLEPVAACARVIGRVRAQGIEESLRQVLSAGMEPAPAVQSPSDSPAMGGTENPTASHSASLSNPDAAAAAMSAATEDSPIPETAAAAGGRYPVSMEQRPFAISVMAGRSTGAVCPVEGTLTSGYGPREHPITGQPDFHTGIDISAPLGTPVRAAAAGVVEACGESPSLGNYIIVRHSAQALTAYCHCHTLLKSEGETVNRGETVALVGSTGVSTGPHLHFECVVDGMLTDPGWILELQ